MSPLTRRGLLRAGAGGTGVALSTALVGCGGRKRPTGPPAGVARTFYGSDHHNQFGDLYLPKGTPKATVVSLHGGFWLDEYGLDLMVPLAKALVAEDWAVWNLEYRRLGSGGGWPATFTDVAAGIDHLTRLRGVDPGKVVLLGHSAGGHLAVWAASRTAKTPGGSPAVKPRGVVSLAGALDLTGGEPQNLGGGVIDRLLGGTPKEVPDHYRLGDPIRLVPASCPVGCVRGRSDDIVPRDQATRYVAAAKQAGGTATFDEVAGDHFTMIDPKAKQAWTTTVGLLTSYATG